MLTKRRHELQAANCEEYKQEFEKLKTKTVAELATLTTLIVGGITFADDEGEKKQLTKLYTYLALQSLEIERM